MSPYINTHQSDKFYFSRVSLKKNFCVCRSERFILLVLTAWAWDWVSPTSACANGVAVCRVGKALTLFGVKELTSVMFSVGVSSSWFNTSNNGNIHRERFGRKVGCILKGCRQYFLFALIPLHDYESTWSNPVREGFSCLAGRGPNLDLCVNGRKSIGKEQHVFRLHARPRRRRIVRHSSL